MSKLKAFWLSYKFVLLSPFWVLGLNVLLLEDQSIEDFVNKIFATSTKKELILRVIRSNLPACGLLMLGWTLYMMVFAKQIQGSAFLVLAGYPLSGFVLALHNALFNQTNSE